MLELEARWIKEVKRLERRRDDCGVFKAISEETERGRRYYVLVIILLCTC